MKKGDRKGISHVVAIILIILIVIAAIAFLYIQLFPQLRIKSSECLNPSLTVDTVSGYTFYDYSSAVLSVQIKRGADGCSYNKMQMIFGSGGDSRAVIVDAPGENNARRYDFLDFPYRPSYIKVAPVEDGEPGAISSEINNIPEGKTVKSGDGEENENCVPYKTCKDYKNNKCGNGLSDGCANVLNCNSAGQCNANQECVNGLCVISGCQSKTCADYPGQCGELSDGCGGIINCDGNCLTGSCDNGFCSTTLFEAIHFGHNQGNWNVGLWRHYGNGIQIPYGVTCPSGGSEYPGGPVNRGGSGYYQWNNGNDAHDFAISYNPALRQLSITAGIITESGDDFPRISPQSVCNGNIVLYEGGDNTKVRKIKIQISATAGNNVYSCYFYGCSGKLFDTSTTSVSNLKLNGNPINGETVTAVNTGDNEIRERKSIEIDVPDNSEWTLTGTLSVSVSPASENYVPKESRTGMYIYGIDKI